MKRICGVLIIAVVGLSGVAARAADDDAAAKAILDKAIKALGGEEKLAKAKAYTTRSKGKLFFGENASDFVGAVTYNGLDQYRSEFEGDFGGNKFKAVLVVNGEKGWRKFGDMGGELGGDDLANEKRNHLLQVIAFTPLALKGKGFKIAAAGEEKVADKPAVGLKVTAPDGKDFTLWYDKQTGLPVKQTAKVAGFMGEEASQVVTYSDYKEFGGVKRATKSTVERDGMKFVESEVTEFKVLDKVDPKTFAEPE